MHGVSCNLVTNLKDSISPPGETHPFALYSMSGCIIQGLKEVRGMPAQRKVPSDSILQKWVEEGLDHKQMQQRIKEQFGEDVALSSISGALSRAGLTNRVRYDEFIPWGRIALEHNHSYQLTMLRIAARLHKGLPVRDVDRRRFERWAAELKAKGVVVHYDYDTEEGWFYTPARPGVDTGLIRVPDEIVKGS